MSHQLPELWDAATGYFEPSVLRRAIVGRGWTVEDFARDAGLNQATVYALLGRKRVPHPTTAIAIFRTLSQRVGLTGSGVPGA
jgi:hypothetical protein